jgi:single-strand DNA-binding protein
MFSLNERKIMGNLGADPEITATANGTQRAKLQVATTRSYKDKNDEWQEETTWHNVIMYGPRAEYVKAMKGDRVYVSGSHEVYSFTNDKGEKQNYEYLKAETINIVTKRNADDASSSKRFPKAAPSKPAIVDVEFNADGDDDLPF